MKKLLIAAVILLAGCATTEFKSFEAKNNVHEGTGGTKTVVDGMEMWANGTPPRKYKILGIIEDDRPGGPLIVAQLPGDIAKKARESGGDAVIELGSQSQITGFVSNSYATGYASGGTANAFGSGFAMPMQRRSSKYAVIKYLD